MSASAPEVCEPAAVAPGARPKASAVPAPEPSASASPDSTVASPDSTPASPDPAAVRLVDLAAVSPLDLAAELTAAGSRLVLIGVTRDGRRFRPSDWAERLASVMAQYRPGQGTRAARSAHLGYSPLVVPSEQNGDKCVIVDPRLRDVEPLAWAFVLNFAGDNGLRAEKR